MSEQDLARTIRMGASEWPAEVEEALRELVRRAALYREAVEAMEKVKSYIEQLENLAYDFGEQVEKHAVMLDVDAVLAKARAALGNK